MKTTKNVMIVENQSGYTIRNNRKDVEFVPNMRDAWNTAIAIAKKENKGIICDTWFDKSRMTVEKVQKV